MKSWTEKQIKDHTEAARLLGVIKDEFKSFVKDRGTNLREQDGVAYIKSQYKKHGLVCDDKKEFAIVAFRQNTNQVHYFPKSKDLKLKTNSLILLDIWARLDKKNTLPAHKSQQTKDVNKSKEIKDLCSGPYADATFMFLYKSKSKNQKLKINKQHGKYQKAWEVLQDSRGKAIDYIKREVTEGRFPRGLDIDRVAHDVIGEAGLGHGIKHTIGHSLGFDDPHGKLPDINWREYSPILQKVGYTIEPGIYLKDFGMRTEIDFYIDSDNKVVITTPIQDQIELI